MGFLIDDAYPNFTDRDKGADRECIDSGNLCSRPVATIFHGGSNHAVRVVRIFCCRDSRPDGLGKGANTWVFSQGAAATTHSPLQW